MSNKPFAKLYNHVALDQRLEGTTANLFGILLALAGKSGKIVIKIKKLAELLNRTPCTVRVHLNKLIALGYLDKILRKSKYDPKQNIASLFIVHPEGKFTQADLPTRTCRPRCRCRCSRTAVSPSRPVLC